MKEAYFIAFAHSRIIRYIAIHDPQKSPHTRFEKILEYCSYVQYTPARVKFREEERMDRISH
jgi:hypothetical protein